MYYGGSKPKTHCKKGHKFTKKTTYLFKNGKRGCKICRNEYYRNLKESKGIVLTFLNANDDHDPVMSLRDIAKELGITHQGVAMIITRAINKLRKHPIIKQLIKDYYEAS